MRLMWLAERPHDLKLTVPSRLILWLLWLTLHRDGIRSYLPVGPAVAKPPTTPKSDTANVVNVADDHRTSRQKAASDRVKADRIGRHAASLTNEADLP